MDINRIAKSAASDLNRENALILFDILPILGRLSSHYSLVQQSDAFQKDEGLATFIQIEWARLVLKALGALSRYGGDIEEILNDVNSATKNKSVFDKHDKE